MCIPRPPEAGVAGTVALLGPSRTGPLRRTASRERTHSTAVESMTQTSSVQVVVSRANTRVWRCVYRAIDQFGHVIDVYLSKRRDTAAARCSCARALNTTKVPPTEVVNRKTASALAFSMS